MSFIDKQPSSRQGRVQTVAYTGTAGTLGAVFGPETWQVRLSADSACFWLVSGGNSATATAATTSNGSYLPIGVVDYITVSPGMTLSVIQSTAGGTLNVTEMY